MSKIHVYIIFSILFLASLLLHAKTFGRELIGHHDFINGQLLTTALIWSREGILTHSFTPVYTFNSDVPVEESFGAKGRNGRMYYVSYPPFAFIFTYLISKIPFVGLTANTPKIASLFIYIVTSILLFRFLLSRYGIFTALASFSVYAIFPISAYILGNVLSEDVLIHPFWFISFLMLSRLKEKANDNQALVLYFIGLFLVSMTEWLGLFLSFSITIYLLFFAKNVGWDRKKRTELFVLTIGAPILAYLLTYVLYLGQIDAFVLNNVFIRKFLFRTNTSILAGGNIVTSFTDSGKFFITKLLEHADLALGAYFFPLIAATAIVTNRLSARLKLKIFEKGEKATVFFFFFFPPLIHLILLNQFHTAHEFAALYFYFIIIFCFARFFSVVEKYFKKSFPRYAAIGSITTLVFVIAFIVYSGKVSYRKYFIEWLWLPPGKTYIYESMRKLTDSHDLILTNYESLPRYWFYVQRNLIGNVLGEQVSGFKNPYPNVKNVYFMSDVYVNAEVSCGGRSIEYKEGLFICKIN